MKLRLMSLSCSIILLVTHCVPVAGLFASSLTTSHQTIARNLCGVSLARS